MYQIPNYNIGGSGLSPEELVNRGRALISPQPQYSDFIFTPEQIARMDAIKQNMDNQQPTSNRGWNPITNAIEDIKEIGTGAVATVQHPIKTIVEPLADEVLSLGQTYNDFGGGGQGLIQAISKLDNDTINFLISNYGITTQDIYDAIRGDKKASEVVGTALTNAYQRPVMTALDILPATKLAKVSKATKGVTKTAEQVAKEVKNLSPAQKVANALNVSSSEIGSNANKFLDQVDKIKKNYKPADIEKAVEAHLTGAEAPDVDKTLLRLVGESISSYDEMLSKTNKYGESLTKEDKFAIADSQAVNSREGNIRSFDEIKRERQPYYDKLQNVEMIEKEIDHPTKGKIKVQDRVVTPHAEGLRELEELAKTGDTIAQDILENKKQFDKGYLRIVPMADITDIEKIGTVNKEGRVFAGKASDRLYGSATAKQITDTYFTKTEDILNKKMLDFISTQALDEIAQKGTLGGVDLVTENTKKTKYINPEAKSVEQLVESATEQATNTNKVAIDEKLLSEIDKQFTNLGSSNPFGKGILSDIWQVGKSNMLTSGSYLVGNAQTGLFNAAMDVGFNPVRFAQNFIDAWRSNGELSKEAGIFRRLSPMNKNIKNPVLKGALKYSGTDAVSNMLNYFDTKMQNTFAEMALHEDMRRRGIKYETRANALREADDLTLAQVIDRAKTVALMNKTNTLLPKNMAKVWAMTNPYWRWADTAAQSSYYMLMNHPQLSNMLLNKFMGNVAFDKEMQNRMELGVQSDKPFVSYRYNPETKQLQEVTAEFMPVMNTLKLIGETADAVAKGDGGEVVNRLGLLSVPILTEVSNSFVGKDRYGRPIISARSDRGGILTNYRTGERYEMTPEGMKPLRSGTFTEIGGTMLKNMIGSQNFINKIAAPTTAATARLLTGRNIRYYQPYQNQLVGEFREAGSMPIMANPRRSTGIQEVIDLYSGAYARNYDPRIEYYENRPVSPSEYKQLMRGFRRRDARTMDILRKQGGEY